MMTKAKDMETKTIQDLLPKQADFQQTVKGHTVDLYYLKAEGIQVAITNYGARIVSLLVKNKEGEWVDVVIGFDSLKAYLETDEIYHGTIAGRYANRIARGTFSLNNQTFHLPINNGVNHLHGGPDGFHNAVWNVEKANESVIELSYLSKDREEGYPGNLTIRVVYTLEANALRIDFNATSDQDTVINVTNHSYFNLNGQGSGSIEKHQLQINASSFTAIDETLIPTGELMPVTNTPFDFTIPKSIGLQINEKHPQIQYGQGYDHNFVLDKKENELSQAAKAVGDQTGITLEVLTTEPGVQLYTGNFMKGANRIKQGFRDEYRSGFCLETQHFPDSPNHPHFPSTILKAGDRFTSTTIFRFTIAN
jgi:aldose 1-epimerase